MPGTSPAPAALVFAVGESVQAVDVAPLPPKRVGVPLELGRVVEPLRRGARALACVAIASALIGAVAGKRAPREYKADATVVVSTGTGTGAATDAGRQVRTIAESVKLQKNLVRARDEVHVAEPLERFGRSIQVETPSETNLILIHVTRDDAVVAARLADAMVAAVVAARTDDERRRLEGEATRLEGELGKARAALLDARGRREKFRADNGVSDLPSELRVTLELVARHAEGAEAAAATAEAEQARSSALAKAAAAEPALTVVAEQHVAPDVARLADIDAQIAAESGRLDAGHPRLVSLRAQASALRDKIGATPPDGVVTSKTVSPNPRRDALQSGITSSTSERRAAEKRHEALAQLTQASRSRIDKLAALQGPLAALDGDVKQAEEQVRDLSTRHARAVEAARSPVADVTALAPAVVPSRPLHATGRTIAILAPFVGLLVAAGVLVGRALKSLQATTPAEVAFWSQLPILASVKGRDDEAVDGFRADLESHVRHWRGRTLLVSLDEESTYMARSLGRWLGAVMPSDAEVARASLEGDDAATVRRQARDAARIVVLARAGTPSVRALASLRGRLSTDAPTAFAVFDVPPPALGKADRLGELGEFLSRRVASETRSVS